jgi:5-formyltetrahydrofolate cyclo-ligase
MSAECGESRAMAMPSEVSDWRKSQRAEMLARREAVPVEVRRAWNERVTRFLIEGFGALEGCVVGFCWPFKGECDGRFFIHHLRQRGAVAALPAVVAKNEPLQFREWWPGVSMAPGVFDLPVPQQTSVVRPDALLIPPVGFGPCGYRLGYGGGYFDRTLATMAPQPLKIAIAFEVSRMPTIQPQPHDVPMDFIVTEGGVHRVSAPELILMTDPDDVRRAVARLMQDRGLPRRA